MPDQYPAWLIELGWDDRFQDAISAPGFSGLEPARVCADHGAGLLVHSAGGTIPASLARTVQDRGRDVAVGDWVALRPGTSPEAVAVLSRRTAIRRKPPDAQVRGQVLAANIDVAFIATSAGNDFNLRRVERILTAVLQSGAAASVLLTKSDAYPTELARTRLAAVAGTVPVIAVSNLSGQGLDEVRSLIGHGRTAVLLGSSGVGKSTLVNRLAGGGILRTGDVHRTGQGRHTTSHRQLILLPGGGMVIDTPGLRELQLWAGDQGLEDAFEDIQRLARICRFADCSHGAEPDCAIRAALLGGSGRGAVAQPPEAGPRAAVHRHSL